MAYHVVRQGETLARIAERRRLAADDIWEADENAGLREQRGDGHILRPGDLLFVPESPEAPSVEIDVQTTNRFEAVVPRVPLSLRIVHNGEVAAGESFVASAGAWRHEGSTDGDGRLEAQVPVTAERVDVALPGLALQYSVRVGSLDPGDAVSGVQDRLHALGYYGGPSHGQVDGATARALSSFQEEHDLTVTGQIDEVTRQALAERFGC